MAECFLAREGHIYDELWDTDALSAATLKGDCRIKQDVFGFYAKDAESATEEICFIYRMRQVLAKKLTGTGEAILAGDRLYYIVALDAVSPTVQGVIGTNSYFCGWAKKDAGENEATVLMNFDGTRYNSVS